MTISKDTILETAKISKHIVDIGLEGKRLSQSPEAKENKELYHKEIKTRIDGFKKRYHNGAPEILLKDFLKKMVNQNRLNREFEAKGFRFFGWWEIRPYVWASITKIDSKIKSLKYSHYPQFYILINKEGIKFGFDYGHLVKNDDPIVDIVRTDDTIQVKIFEILKKNVNLKLYSKGYAKRLPNQGEKLKPERPEDIGSMWTNTSQIFGHFKKVDIPNDIEDQIENAFNDLSPLFLKTSGIDGEITEKDSSKSEVWIFQANPNEFNINEALNELSDLLYDVKWHKKEIKKNHTVYFYQSGSDAKIIGSGTIISNPRMLFPNDKQKKYRKKKAEHVKGLQVWIHINNVLKTPIQKEELKNHPELSKLSIITMGRHTNNKVTPTQARILNQLYNERKDNETVEDKFSWEDVKDELEINFEDIDFEIEDLHFEEDQKTKLENRISAALEAGNHIILIGPPGTGKSKLAKEIYRKYCEREKVNMSTATSDWSTFETIGGYRPKKDGSGLEFHPGIFLRCFQNDNKEPINDWLILDEINRADIDKAFGSLFSALTGDDITLPFETSDQRVKMIGNPKDETEVRDNRFIIPKTWRIIATMNTFDKSSLYEMSYAFMRRFAFIPVEVPTTINDELILAYKFNWEMDIDKDVRLKIIDLWKCINKKRKDGLVRKIGPAIIRDICNYVMISDSNDFVSAIIMYVIPQYEGLPEDYLKELIKDLIELDSVEKNKKQLLNYASDFFGINIK